MSFDDELSGPDLEALSTWFIPRELRGTWTPTFAGTGTAGTFTYTANTAGIYQRVGPLVYIEARIAISAIGTPPTGNIVVGGLPWASSSTPPAASLTIGQIANINLTGSPTSVIQLVARIDPGESVITLVEVSDNAASTALAAANFTNAAANLILSGWYRG